MAEFSKRLNSWASQTGKKGPGFCVICGDFGDLTKDHVPPKGCTEITNAVLGRLMAETGGGTGSGKSIYIQGGLKFRTICGRCNNERLGLQFDPELKFFVDSMRAALKGASQHVVLPRIVNGEANLHLVARAIIGHILAAHSVAETEKKRDHLGASEELRQYFLNPGMVFPDRWRLYCWPYFARRQVVLRHAVRGGMSASKHDVYGHLLKFMPFAFWLVYDPPVTFHVEGIDITPAGLFQAERTVIAFDLRHTPHFTYPESPTGNHVLLFVDDQSSVVTPVIG